MLTHTEGMVQFEKFTFRLISGGPGIFFCAFGMWLLVHLADRTAQTETESQASQPAHYLSDEQPSTGLYGLVPKAAPSGFLKTGSSIDGNSTQGTCLIRIKKTTVMFGGDEELTPENTKVALNSAVTLLRSQLDPDATDSKANDKISKVSQILKQLEENVAVTK